MTAYLRQAGVRLIDPQRGFNTKTMLYRGRIHMNAWGNLHVAKAVIEQSGFFDHMQFSAVRLIFDRLTGRAVRAAVDDWK